MSNDASTTPLEFGKKLLAEDRFAEAAEQFSLVLQNDPDNIEALRKRSDSFFYEAEYEKALADIETALKIAPDNAELYLDRVTIQTALDEMAETLPDIEKALTLRPNSDDAFAQLATYWLARFDLEKFKAAIDKLLSIAPKSTTGLYYLYIFYCWKADYDNASQYFDQALHAAEKEFEAKESDYFCRLLYGGLLLEKNADQASVLLDRGIKVWPKLPLFYLLRARQQIGQTDWDAADTDLNQAERICRQNDIWSSDLFLQRASYFKNVDEADKAFEQLDLILQRKPNDAWAMSMQIELLSNKITPSKPEEKIVEQILAACNRLNQLASEYYYPYIVRTWINEKQGNEKASEDDLKRAMLLLPNDPESLKTVAWFLIEAGRSNKASELLDRVLKDNPKDGFAHGLRGLAWYYVGAYELSVQDLTLALKLEGPDAQLLKYRGLSQLELGNFSWTISSYRLAAEDFERTLNLTPDDAECWRYLGIAFFQMFSKAWFGRKKYLQQSIENYSKAIEMNPKDADAFQFRALSYWYLKDFDAVIADCNKALVINPKHIDALELRCQTYRKLKNFDKAKEDYQQLEKLMDTQTGCSCGGSCKH